MLTTLIPLSNWADRKNPRGRLMEDRSMVDEVLGVLGTGRQIAPLTSRHPGFGLDDAYRLARAICDQRSARGGPVGRKIGFTNRSAWARLKAAAPIWGYMYASTVHDLGRDSHVSLAGLAEPRIEPEIVFGLAAAPTPDMDERQLADCVAWVAHGFEIVQSIFPGWSFLPPDAVVGFAMHSSLWIGPRHPFPPRASAWARELTTLEVELLRNDVAHDRGRGADVLDGPLAALRAIVALLAADAHNPPLAAGEIITTGTLTRAPPIAAGDVWTTRLTGTPLDAARLAITAA
jgi:2-oxo-3-hexenedioate decarboxylase